MSVGTFESIVVTPEFIDPGYSETEKKEIKKALESEWSITDFLRYEPGVSRTTFKYRSGKDWETLLRVNLHRGQRKLFVAELYFLAEIHRKYHLTFLNPLDVLYVGAAPGEHIPLLARFFPHLHWTLVDPAPFTIEETDHIRILQGYFTTKKGKNRFPGENVILAEDFVNRVDFLINDIRSKGDGTAAGPTSEDIRQNHLENLESTKIIAPKYGASLKNRPPFGDRLMKIFATSEIVPQVWGPQATTESRAWVYPPYQKLIEIDVDEYENWFAWLNYVIRSWMNFSANSAFRSVKGFCGCYDGIGEIYVWQRYFQLFWIMKSEVELTSTIIREINSLTDFLDQGLLKPHSLHGRGNLKIPMTERRKELYQIRKKFRDPDRE